MNRRCQYRLQTHIDRMTSPQDQQQSCQRSTTTSMQAATYLRSSMLKPCKKLRPPAHHLRKIARPAGTSAGAKGSFAGSARHQRSRISASSWTFAVVSNNLRGEPDFHGEHEPTRQAEAPRRAEPSRSSITTSAASRTSTANKNLYDKQQPSLRAQHH